MRPPTRPPLDFEALAQQKTVELLRRLPDLRTVLEQDVEAAYEGDPAAKSYHEIIFCYPGLEAVTIYRVAHELVLLDVPLIPRMMTEARPLQDRHRHPSRRRASARASSSTTAPASSSARRATSAPT